MSPEFQCTANSAAVCCGALTFLQRAATAALGVYRRRIRAVWKVLLHRGGRRSWFFRSRGKVFYDVAKWSKVGGSGGSSPPTWDRSATESRPAAVKAGPRAEMYRLGATWLPSCRAQSEDAHKHAVGMPLVADIGSGLLPPH